MQKVLVAVPNTGWIHTTLYERMLRLISQNINRFHIEFICPQLKCNENCYQWTAGYFLKSGAEFLLQVDADNPWVINCNPLDLCELDKDIVSLPTPVWVLEGRTRCPP